MNTRAFTLALVIASIAMFMVYTFIDEREQNFKTKFGREVPVVIAKVELGFNRFFPIANLNRREEVRF